MMVYAQAIETKTTRHLSQKSKAEFLLFMSAVFFIVAGISFMAYSINAPSFYGPATPILHAGPYRITNFTGSFTFPVNQGNVRYDASTNTIVISNFPQYAVIFVHATVSSVEHPENVTNMTTMLVTSNGPLTLPVIDPNSRLHLIWEIYSLEVSNLNLAYIILSSAMTILFFASSVGTWLFRKAQA